MSIRTKLLVLLGAIALVPAMITATLDTRLLQSLSDDLTRRSAAALSAEALATMQRVAREYADLLDRESRRIRVVLALQAEHAERLLESGGSGEVAFSEQF
ncbi:MAG: hypothetical protein ACU85V_06485, partial [Gammaproteobacteria bacterium]